MRSGHLTREELQALLEIDTPLHNLILRVLHHLLASCKECYRACQEETKTEVLDSAALPTSSLPTQERFVTPELITRLRNHNLSLLKLHRDAERDLTTLMSLTGTARILKVERSHKRFRSPPLVNLLVEESRGALRSDPFEAYLLADLAHAVAIRLPHTLYGSEWAISCLARATAHRGNALRVAGDFHQAGAQLEHARALFEDQGDGDPITHAEILGLLASLRFDQRQLAVADALLSQALGLYRAAKDTKGEAQTLVNQGRLFAESGNPLLAIEVTKRAAGLISAKEHAHLYLCSQHNLVAYLEDLGRFAEAQDLLLFNAPLYRSFPDPWTQLRLAWSHGTIARGLGHLEEAESGLVEVRAGFQLQGSAYDAALVGLDLATVYLRRENLKELQELTRQIVPVFLTYQIHREAKTALAFFEQAVTQSRVTEQMVKKLITCLKGCQRAALLQKPE